MNWALATVKPNTEPSVQRALMRSGFPFHIFRYQSKIIRLRKVVTVLKPLFPRYIFVSFEHAWKACHLDNVQGLVTFGGELAAVSHVLVESLVRSGQNDIIPIADEPVVSSPKFRGGDRVVAIVGILVGHTGRVIRSLASGRVRCEFNSNARIIAELPPLELCLLERPVAKRRRRRYKRVTEEAATAVA